MTLKTETDAFQQIPEVPIGLRRLICAREPKRATSSLPLQLFKKNGSSQWSRVGKNDKQ
jgi:hypothetical protein